MIEAIADADPAAEYPRYIDGAGRAPPEDVGGIPGFELFLNAIADPKHEQHRELKRWHGRPFDPEQPDVDEIQTRMKKLARRRALGKAASRRAAARHAEDHEGTAVLTGFQLPISSPPMVAPSLMSVRRDKPRHMTMLPGGGSCARAR